MTKEKKPKAKSALTNDQKKYVHSNAGCKSAPDIAKHLGVKYQYVYDYLKRNSLLHTTGKVETKEELFDIQAWAKKYKY